MLLGFRSGSWGRLGLTHTGLARRWTGPACNPRRKLFPDMVEEHARRQAAAQQQATAAAATEGQRGRHVAGSRDGQGHGTGHEEPRGGQGGSSLITMAVLVLVVAVALMPLFGGEVSWRALTERLHSQPAA